MIIVTAKGFLPFCSSYEYQNSPEYLTKRNDASIILGFRTQQEATLDEVRKEVMYLIDAFDQPGGGMCTTACTRANKHGCTHRDQYAQRDSPPFEDTLT